MSINFNSCRQHADTRRWLLTTSREGGRAEEIECEGRREKRDVPSSTLAGGVTLVTDTADDFLSVPGTVLLLLLSECASCYHTRTERNFLCGKHFCKRGMRIPYAEQSEIYAEFVRSMLMDLGSEPW